MAKTYSIQATITIEDVNQPPVIDEQPPSPTNLTLTKPTTVAFGKVHDPGGDPLTATLETPIAGCTLAIDAQGNVTLNWSGSGPPVGSTQTRMVVDDGKPD